LETKTIDFVLCTLCLSLLLSAAGATVWFFPLEGTYIIVVNVFLFLLSYGVYSAVLLMLIRKLKPYPVGRFSMNSSAFTYWKINAVLVDLAWKALAPFNTVFTEPLLLSAFGLSAGKCVAIGGTFRDHPLIKLSKYATIGQDSVIVGHAITGDIIVLKPVNIGPNAVVGINCVVMPGVDIGENAVLAPGSVAIQDTHIPANELWGGIPARKIKTFERNAHDQHSSTV